MLIRVRGWSILGLLLTACGSGGEAGADAAPDAAASGDGGVDLPGFRPDRTGHILLTEASFAGPEIGLGAWLYDRVDPLPLELVARTGDCAVYHRAEQGFCEPSCDDGLCTPDDACAPYPVAQSAGAIAVTGLHAPLSFQFGAYGYVVDSELDIADELFDDGVAISASAPGAEVDGFTLTVSGVAPLETDVEYVELWDGVDAEVTWTPAGHGWIQLALRLGWHGSPATDVLLCETADDGSLTIPGELASAMPYFEGGLFQVPSSFGRFDRAVTGDGADSIELFAASLRLIGFAHRYPD